MWRPLFAGFGVPGLINGARCTANNASDCIALQWRALKNVSISGSGTIDGNGFVWWSHRRGGQQFHVAYLPSSSRG